MIVITGASGHIGRETIKALLGKVPATRIVAMVRDLDKAAGLNDLGVSVRKGDYQDYDSLLTAFKGAEKVFLVSAHAFTDLTAQHINVIDAAKQAGVRHLVFTSIFRTANAKYNIPWVTLSMKVTENYLRNSGLDYTILRNTFYIDNLPFYFGDVISQGTLSVPGGQGAVAFATRADLAQASANVLAEEGHENMTYALIGKTSYTFEAIAGIVSEASGKEIVYADIRPEQFIKRVTDGGIPPIQAAFFNDWLEAMKVGDMQGDGSDDLELLLGRKQDDIADYLKGIYSKDNPLS